MKDSKICTNKAGGRRERLIADLLRLQFVASREHQRPLIIASLHVLYMYAKHRLLIVANL
jgi:hypothetical protein